MKYKSWSAQAWKEVLFSDGCHFCEEKAQSICQDKTYRLQYFVQNKILCILVFCNSAYFL